MKKIATGTIKNFLNEHKSDNTITRKYPVGDNEYFDVTIKTKLTITEKSAFIRRVLSGCFDATQNFRPEYITPMLRATIIQMCTNVPVVSMKGDKDENGEALMDIGAMDDLYCALNLDHIDDGQYQFMLNEIVQLTHNAIDWKRHKLLEGGMAEVMSSVKQLVDKFVVMLNDTDMNKLMEYAAKLSKNTDGLDTNELVGAILAADKETT